MNKAIMTALVFTIALSGCGLMGDKPQPAPVVEVKPEPAPPPPPPPPPPPLTHTVKKGETVAAIAKKFGVPASLLLTGNNLKDAKAVKVGMVLTIPGKTAPAPKPVAPAKEPVVKEVPEAKGPKFKPSKSDPYGVESATAPEKGGKKKPLKVDDDATYEKIKTEFHEYAYKWLQKSAALAQSNKDRKEVRQEDGRYVASYSVIMLDTMQTEVKRVEYEHTPYVGHITYQVEVHRFYGPTSQAALASTQDEVKQESMREIFSYSGQKRAWR